MNQAILREKLNQLAEPSYAEFQQKAKCSDRKILGIRTPKIVALAKTLAKTEGRLFLDDFFLYTQVTYEEIILAYKVMGLLTLDTLTTKAYIEHLLTYNDSWATNDTLCNCLTIIKKKPDEYWMFIKEFLSSSNPWDIRFATISMMNGYLTKAYIERTLSLLSQVRREEYYVNMGLGWFFATAVAKFRDKTLPYLENGKLPQPVQKKAIQKCIESFRVNEEDKKLLRSIRQEASRH